MAIGSSSRLVTATRLLHQMNPVVCYLARSALECGAKHRFGEGFPAQPPYFQKLHSLAALQTPASSRVRRRVSDAQGEGGGILETDIAPPKRRPCLRPAEASRRVFDPPVHRVNGHSGDVGIRIHRDVALPLILSIRQAEKGCPIQTIGSLRGLSGTHFAYLGFDSARTI